MSKLDAVIQKGTHTLAAITEDHVSSLEWPFSNCPVDVSLRFHMSWVWPDTWHLRAPVLVEVAVLKMSSLWGCTPQVSPLLHFKETEPRGIWMAQSVKRLTSAQVMILWFMSLSPASGCVDSSEPEACFGFWVSVCLYPIPILSLSLKTTQTLKKKKPEPRSSSSSVARFVWCPNMVHTRCPLEHHRFVTEHFAIICAQEVLCSAFKAIMTIH